MTASGLRTKKFNDTFDDAIEGKLIDKEAGHIKLGDIIIEIDNHSIPGNFFYVLVAT